MCGVGCGVWGVICTDGDVVLVLWGYEPRSSRWLDITSNCIGAGIESVLAAAVVLGHT